MFSGLSQRDREALREEFARLDRVSRANFREYVALQQRLHCTRDQAEFFQTLAEIRLCNAMLQAVGDLMNRLEAKRLAAMN